MSKVPVYVVIVDAGETKNCEMGLFFDAAHAGQFMAEKRLDEIYDNLRLETREMDVRELHSAHHPLFLCDKCIDKMNRSDKATPSERSKSFRCLSCQPATESRLSPRGSSAP